MKDKNKVLKEITLALSLSAITFLAINYKNSPVVRREKKIKRTPSSVVSSNGQLANHNQKKVKKLLDKRNKKNGHSLNKAFTVSNEKKTLETYKKMVHYPSYSTPIPKTQKVDFIQKQLKPDIKQVIGDKNPTIQFQAWSEKNFYNESDKIILFANLTQKGKSKDSRVIAKIENKTSMIFEKDNKGRYFLELDKKLLIEGKNTIQISTDFKGESFSILSRFSFSKSKLELLDQKSIHLDSEGNLKFQNSVKVEKEGNYLVEGIVYHKGEMVAKAHSIQNFKVGEDLLELKFYGYLFYEKKISGRFEIKNIQVSLIDENLSNISTSFFYTKLVSKEYYWDQFNSMPYSNEVIQDKIIALSN